MDRYAVEVEGLRKEYPGRGGSRVVAVDGISFRVRPGELVGLLGANGAGKTTTIKCICSLIRPSAGRIALNGVDPASHPRAALAQVAAVLEGNRNIYWQLTTQQNLEFFAGLQGIPFREVRTYVDQLLQVLQLEDKARTVARMLSRGMQQKLALACALVKRTELLLLDEPTLGLDVTASYELRAILRRMTVEGRHTVLLSSHDMGAVEALCERVIIMRQGHIVTDERVSRLLELFRPRSYQFRLDEQLSAAQLARLREHFATATLQSQDHGSAIEVELPDSRRLYEFLDVLRDGGSAIQSVERRAPSLEEVFVSMARGA